MDAQADLHLRCPRMHLFSHGTAQLMFVLLFLEEKMSKFFTHPDSTELQLLGDTCSTTSETMNTPSVAGERLEAGRGRFKVRRYECSFCDKSFLSKYNFKRHQLIHTGERPFVCDLCQQCFRQKVHLQKHAIKYHSEGFPLTSGDMTVVNFD